MVTKTSWIKMSVGELLLQSKTTLQTGPFGTVLNASEFIKYGIPIISVSEIREGYIRITENTPCISTETYDRLKRYVLKENDIVFARKGSVERSAIIPSGDNKFFLGSDGIRLRVDENIVSPIFLLYIFQDPSTQNYIMQNAYGTTMVGLNEKILSSISFSIPVQISEQDRIAEALSDVDSMISSLEKLIAKKKAVKQGAMQELLTGKKRLPGFTGEWAFQDMKTHLHFQVGYPFSSDYFNSDGFGLRLIKNRDLKSDDQVYYTTESYDQTFIVRNGDVLIGMDGDFLPCLWKKGTSLLNQRVGRIQVTEKMNLIFAYYRLQKPLAELQEGTGATTVKHLSHTDIEKMVIKIPIDVCEQVAIASILSDMDNEIEALEQKLDKTRQIKQGMMQQLLTGKIRLISETADKAPVEVTAKPQHNHQFDDAVVIAAIVNAFYTDKFPLGRKKVQKLLYLLRRKQDADISAFKKKAAGPYADEIRYKGGEPIAVRSKYIATKKGEKGTSFEKGEKIKAALAYIEEWGMSEQIDWLVSTFKYTRTNDLELYATIDMAICDLKNAGEEISVASIKKLIASNNEWKAKLSKSYFTDNDIERAISFCQSIFN